MKRNLTYDDYAKKLEGEYAEAYEQVKLYFDNCMLDPYAEENCMTDIVELLLAAQAEQRPASTVVGEDIAAFCHDTIEENRENFGKRVWRGIANTSFMLALMGVIGLIMLICDVIVGKEIGDTQMPLARVLGWAVFIAITPFLTMLIRKLVWDHRRERHEKLPKLQAIDALFWIPFIIFKDLVPAKESAYQLPLWIGVVVMLGISVPILLIQRHRMKKREQEHLYFGEIDEDDELWNNKIEALRKNIALHNRDFKDHTLDTPAKRGTFVKWMIYLRIFGFSAIALALGWGGYRIVALFVADFDMIGILSIASLMLIVIVIIALLVSAVVEWIKFKKKYDSTDHDIMDDSLLKKLF